VSATPRRIDVHHHLMSPRFAAARKVATGPGYEDALRWTPAASLAQMDKAGIATAMMSNPALWGWFDKDEARALARDNNEFAAQLRRDHPGRFGVFAAIPMPDIEASLREIEYAFDTLAADGIGTTTNYGTAWPGDPAFDPVFEELHRRKAVVYTHPTTATCCTNLLHGIGDSIIEYGTDTTRCIAQIVLSGRAARFSDIRFIWSHGGGTMPFLLVRFTRAAKGQFKKNVPNGFLHEARRFYYDTAAIYARAPLLALREVVTLEQIVFGTDVPWGNPAEIAKEVAEAGVFTEEELRRIDRDNALRILPQFR
jgi:predicted TIM-barrel fold metal-dependent hydrolase